MGTIGKVDIALQSSVAAGEVYDGLRKAEGVLELIVDLNRDCAWRDLFSVVSFLLIAGDISQALGACYPRCHSLRRTPSATPSTKLWELAILDAHS